jgi:hypothetical protein
MISASKPRQGFLSRNNHSVQHRILPQHLLYQGITHVLNPDTVRATGLVSCGYAVHLLRKAAVKPTISTLRQEIRSRSAKKSSTKL